MLWSGRYCKKYKNGLTSLGSTRKWLIQTGFEANLWQAVPGHKAVQCKVAVMVRSIGRNHFHCKQHFLRTSLANKKLFNG
jgi:hypothetical protein